MGHLSAAKKWPSRARSKYLRRLDISSGKWSASTYGRSNFPAGPTRADGRIGRCGPRPAMPGIAAAQGALVADAAGQGRRHRPASGTAGYPDMVAPGPAARPRFSLQAWRRPRNHASERTAGAGGAQLARHRRRAGRRTAGGAVAARRRRQGKPCNSVASRRHLPVRPQAAGRRSGAAVAGAGAGRRGERARRRRPRRGVPDRRLAAAPGRNRDRARHRSRGHDAGLHRQRPDDAGHPGARP